MAERTGHLARFVTYGSFVTDKIDPNDVDVFSVFDDDFDASQADPEARLLLDHATADAHFGASVFWLPGQVVVSQYVSHPQRDSVRFLVNRVLRLNG